MAPRWVAALLNLTLRGGSVYYLQHRALTSPEPHFFVVLNADPHHDAFLVLTVASSKLDRVRARSANLPSETLVQVSPAEYADFQVDSIVDCNHYFRVTKAELLQKLQAGLAGEMAPVPDSILDRLRRAMLASPLVEAEVKALLH